MEEEQFYKVAHEKIVHETVSQETMVIDLSTGTYFSFNPTASYLWNQLLSNRALHAIIHDMKSAFPADETALSNDIHSFVDSLIAQKLLVIAAPKKDTASEKPPFDSYSPPAYETHTDMESLLLADPIHEFNE